MFHLFNRKKKRALRTKQKYCCTDAPADVGATIRDLSNSSGIGSDAGSIVFGAASAGGDDDTTISTSNIVKQIKNHTLVDMSQSPPVVISSIVKFKRRPPLDAKYLYKIPMIPVKATFGIVTDHPDRAMEFSRMAKYERRSAKKDITVIFAIRRPGCGACRGHGMQLTEFAKNNRDVCLVGAIKHIHVDDEALIDFYRNYFRFPLYMDSNWDIFKALGARKITMWKLLSSVPKMDKKYRERNITNIPFGGDIFTQGGVLILDRKGQLRYAHFENYGEDLDIEEFEQVLREIRSEQDHEKRSHCGASRCGGASVSTTATHRTTCQESPLQANASSLSASAPGPAFWGDVQTSDIF